MEYVETILSIASEIYELYETVKDNKETCQRVLDRVKSLEQLVESIKKRNTVHVSEDVEWTLKEVINILKAGRELVKKCTTANLFKRVTRAFKRKEDLKILIERINDGFQQLAVAMQLEQGTGIYMVYQKVSREKDDEAARRKDDKELKDLIEKNMREQPEELEKIRSEVEKLIEKLSRPQDNSEGIRMIKLDELEYDREPFMKTPTSVVYKGKYRRFQVAIKRYMEPVNCSPSKMRAFFEREVVTMKQFESPNILRMYGICVRDKDGPNPQFLIVTEYCEKGSLRELLDSNIELSWVEKARMCLDAAQGLYRLHNTEVRSRVHGCITSSKFLVAKDFTVKLGGFELAKTETSLRRSKIEESRSSYYESPQKLNNINYDYTKECEIYSFGIVLWEIATRKIPFKDMSLEEIQNQVCVQKCNESIPDCPKPLEELINDCRAFDPFHRPSAGALVDKLQIVVAQLEEQ